MMRSPSIRVVGFAVLLAVAGSAHAAPLDLKQVSPDATWLAHVDFDALRKSTVAHQFMQRYKDAGRIEFAKKMLGMDPEQDLHGATFYGREIGKHKGVMILHAKVDRDRIKGMAQMLPGHDVVEYGAHKLHSWTHEPRPGAESHTIAATFCGDDMLVLASSVDLLKQAVDVLDGKQPGLSSTSALAGNIPAGTTILMRLEGVSAAHLPEHCQLAKQTNSFRFVTGEHDGTSFYRARATMTNPEVVGQVKEVIEGVRALGEIHCGDNKTEKKLVDALKIKTDGTTLTVLWSAPASDVWAVIDAHRKFIEERMHRHGGGHHGPDGGDGFYKKGAPKPNQKSPEEDF